jgi:hypothetical protein
LPCQVSGEDLCDSWSAALPKTCHTWVANEGFLKGASMQSPAGSPRVHPTSKPEICVMNVIDVRAIIDMT